MAPNTTTASRSHRGLACPTVLCTLLAGVPALAADPYGVGDGRDGIVTISAPATPVNAWWTLDADVPVGATELPLSDTNGLAAGDLVLLVAVGTDDAFPAGDATTVDIGSTDIGRAELHRITSLAGTTAILERPLEGAWSSAHAQVVDVPEYEALTVSAGAEIVATPWDGARGGIVALVVQGDLQLDGAISTDGLGFRGGVVATNPAANRNCTGFTVVTPDGGFRGEGVTLLFGGDESGSGNRANGGGGGNCHNSGGGGGGGGGAGGNGGFTQQQADDEGGRGGAALAHGDGPERLLLGGGGGAGEANLNPSPGGAGGGAIWIRAGRVLGTGTLSADGASAPQAPFDGSGGGGSGGTIVVRSLAPGDCPALLARGGGGGAASTGHGPGGGGGGGVIHWLAPDSCALQVDAGPHGTQSDATLPGGNAYGAGPADPLAPPYVGVAVHDPTPWTPDFDSDGLSDLDESDLGTDPQLADTDGDGLDDGLEADTGTDPLDPDTDGDGLEDGVEDADADGVVDQDETDPRVADTDGDGISDGEEVAAGSDPLVAEGTTSAADVGSEPLGFRTLPQDPGGCSCGGVPTGSAAWPVALAVALLRPRRRRR